MNDKRIDTYDKIRQTRRDQLIDQCLNLGMPVVGDEDEETLEMYLDMADDDFDDFGFSDENFDDDGKSDVDSDAKKTNIIGKIASLFM